MSGRVSFEEYYEREMLPVLKELEERRRQAWQRFWRVLAVAIVLALVGIGLATQTRPPIAGIVCAGAGVVTPIIAWLWLFGDLEQESKRRVISALARFVDPSLTYDSKGEVPQSQFEASGLFSDDIDRYHGEDLVRGRIGATDITFGEIHAEHENTHTDAKGNRTTSWNTIFKGLFIIADFNKALRGRTVVLPDVAEKLFGHLGQSLQGLAALFERGDLVKLEDPRFEREFVVYADDQVEARYVLTPALMERLVDFKRKADCPTRFSFAGPNVYIAIETGRNMWEPDITDSFLDQKPLRKHLRDLEFAAGVVQDLDLNTRIWTKE